MRRLFLLENKLSMLVLLYRSPDILGTRYYYVIDHTKITSRPQLQAYALLPLNEQTFRWRKEKPVDGEDFTHGDFFAAVPNAKGRKVR